MLWFILIMIVLAVLVSQAGRSTSSEKRTRARGAKYRVTIEGPYGNVDPELTDSDHLRASRRAWVEPGRSVVVADTELGSGMMYVGQDLPAIDSWVGVDPALVNPKLKVSRGGRRESRSDLGYWPSYSKIGPTERRAYLSWIATGRRNPDVPLGFVFLFFYGIERRVLFDLSHDESVAGDLPEIQDELEELIRVYGDDGSFTSYGRGLLNVVRYHRGLLTVDSSRPLKENPHWGLPLEVAVSLGHFVKRGEPIPVEWAHSWAVCSPEIGLRTPAQRCPREFEALFKVRYRDEYGDGMKIREPKSRLRLEYRPASQGLAGSFRGINLDLPDVAALSAPQRNLQTLVDHVQDELDKYSRYVGRHNDRTSVAAQSLLPAELVGTREDEGTAALLGILRGSISEGEEIGRVKVDDLVALFPTKKRGTLYKNEARTLCDLIRKMGFGIEPDTARGGQNLGRSEIAMIYRIPDGDVGEVEWSDAATLLLRLGAAVAASNDSITEEEERALEAQLEEALSLNEAQRLRLRAHLRWSLAHPASMRGVRRKTEGLSEADRERVARAALAIAGSDGHIDPAEMTSLGKIYDVLGFPEERLYSEVHEIALSDSDGSPVTVAKGDAARNFEIPQRPKELGSAGRRVSIRLDPAKVEQISQDSKVASELLSKVFEEEEGEDEGPGETAAIVGLGGTHSAVFQLIIKRSRWSDEELSALIEQHGLFPAGVIEVLNEAAFDKCGEPLIESGEGWEINEYAAEEMTS
jgi:tellurite resistance protein